MGSYPEKPDEGSVRAVSMRGAWVLGGDDGGPYPLLCRAAVMQRGRCLQFILRVCFPCLVGLTEALPQLLCTVGAWAALLSHASVAHTVCPGTLLRLCCSL